MENGTVGFEAGQKVRFFKNEVITNKNEIDVALKKNIDPPEPIMKTYDYVEAGHPQGRSVFCGMVTDKHKKTFPKTWATYVDGEQQKDGTSIIKLPEMSEALAKIYNGNGIKFIEDLASLEVEQVINALPQGRKMHENAKKYLSAVKGNQMEQQQQEIADLKEQVARLSESKSPPAKDKKPPKAKKVAEESLDDSEDDLAEAS